MGLVIPQLCFPLLAALTLQQLIFENPDKAWWLKKLKVAGFVAAGITACLLIFYTTADFKGSGDASLKNNFTQMMISQAMRSGQQLSPDIQMRAEQFASVFTDAIVNDRQTLFLKDFLRMAVLIGLAYLVIWLFLKDRMKAQSLLIALIALSSLDIIGIARRYLNNDEFVDEATYQSAFQMSQADAQIKQDTGYYRVFNQMVSPFDESLPSYYHNTIGGYHPAKLSIFQDLYENQLGKGNMQVFNMMNTKYFIVANPQNGQPVAQRNPDAFGPVWFVRGIHFVKDGKEEMKALDSISLRDTAVVQEKFRASITGMPVTDSTASISLVENRNDDITYTSSSASPQFAVFSEMYYPEGWEAYIDDKPAPIVKTNYALRGLSVPAGTHTISFHFRPSSYKLGNTLVLWSALLVYLILIGGGILLWRNHKKKSTTM